MASRLLREKQQRPPQMIATPGPAGGRGIALHNAGIRLSVTTCQSWFDAALGVFVLLAAGKFYVLNPDHGHQPPVLLLESNIHTAVMCVRISLDSKWLAVQMSSTQIGLYDLTATGMSRGTCSLIITIKNQRRNTLMRNGVLWTDHPQEGIMSQGIYGSEQMQTLVLVTSQGLETFNILPGMTNARLARHIRVTVSRFWYLPAERFLTLATGKNGHTLRSFLLLEGPPLRLPRVQLPTAVSPSNVFVCCLYKELFIGVLQAGWLSLREISRERVQQARSYELQQLDLSADAADNQVRVQVVDNLVVVHDLRVRLSAAVDLRFRHGNGAASRACCLAERSVGSKRFDAYCVDNVFLQDGLILNPHTGELRRLHFRLPALVAWAPNPVLRVDIMLRRRPVGTHGQTVRIDDESMDNHVAAIDEALETDEGRKDNRLVYPTPKALVIRELQMLVTDPVPMGQLSACFDVINKQFRHAFGVDYKRPVRPSSGLPSAPPPPSSTKGVAALRGDARSGSGDAPPKAVDLERLPAFRRVTSSGVLSGIGVGSGGGSGAHGAAAGAGRVDIVPGVSFLGDAPCAEDAVVEPAQRRGMGIFGAAMELAEDEYNVHGTLLIMPEDVHEHVFAPLVEAVLARAGQAVEEGRDIDHGAFAVNPLRPTCAQAATALMDYFRSLHMYMVPVTWELHMLLVKLLLGCERLGLLHQLLQYHILHDSMPVAQTLIKQGQGHPALVQVALDMMRRLKQFTPMVKALLRCGEIFSAMREVRRHPQLVSKSLIKDFFEATVKAARARKMDGEEFIDLFWSLHSFLICWVPSVVKKSKSVVNDAKPRRTLSFGTINCEGIPEALDEPSSPTPPSASPPPPPSGASGASGVPTPHMATPTSISSASTIPPSSSSDRPSSISSTDSRRLSKPELRAMWLQQAGTTQPRRSGGPGGAGSTPTPSPAWAVLPEEDVVTSDSDHHVGSGGGGGGGGSGVGDISGQAPASGGAPASASGGSGAGAGAVRVKNSPRRPANCSAIAHEVGEFPADLFEGAAGRFGEDAQLRQLFGFPEWM